MLNTLGLIITIAALGSFTATPALAQPNSFSDIKAVMNKDPLTTLPKHSHFSVKGIAQSLLHIGTELMNRVGITVSDPSDTKERAPKVLHPMGVCATATWNITTPTTATGLLAEGTNISAIVRLSSATNQTTYSANIPRVLAIAVKLFPTLDPDQRVTTRNLLTTDEHGLDGTIRNSFFYADPDAARDAYYSNDAGHGIGLAAKLGFQLFARSDTPSDYRPLYPLTEVEFNGEPVNHSRTPDEVRLVPHLGRKITPMPADFRDEIRAYKSHEIVFDIVLPAQAGVKVATTIGALTLDEPVISVGCDQELTFHHHPMHRGIDQSDTSLLDTQLNGRLRVGPHTYRNGKLPPPTHAHHWPHR